MRFRSIILLFVTLLVACGGRIAPDSFPAAATLPRSPSQAPSPAPPGPGAVSVLHVPYGPTTRDVWVYRPAVPESAEVPVVYFLHGLPGGPADVFTAAGAQAVVDRYVAAGGRPFVLASPDGNGAVHADTEWADAKDGSDEMESFLLRTVIPAVEGVHPRDRAHRAVAGFSMGAYGAMNVSLRSPDRFSQVAAIAGYYHVDDPDGMFRSDAPIVAANDPEVHVDAARSLRILLVDGDRDTAPGVKGETQRFAGLLAQNGISAATVIVPGIHSWNLVAEHLVDLVQFFAAGWRAGVGEVRGGGS